MSSRHVSAGPSCGPADGNLLPSPGELADLRRGDLDLARQHAHPTDPAVVAASTLTSPTLRTTISAGTVDVVDSLRELGNVGISRREQGG